MFNIMISSLLWLWARHAGASAQWSVPRMTVQREYGAGSTSSALVRASVRLIRALSPLKLTLLSRNLTDHMKFIFQRTLFSPQVGLLKHDLYYKRESFVCHRSLFCVSACSFGEFVRRANLANSSQLAK